MKISKSLLKAIAVAVTISTTMQACVKDDIKSYDENGQPIKTQKPVGGGCPGCGMG